MKRIRTIKPEFFTSEDVTSLPIEVRMTFIGLWLYVDDHGNENAKASLVKAAIWPEDDEITLGDIDDHLLLLVERGLVSLYTIGSRTYLSIASWKKHQKVDRPSPSNVPKPPETPLATGSRESLAKEGREGESDEGVSGETREDSASESGGGEAGAAPHATATPPASSPPSPFCPKHPEGTLAPCRACGNTRLLRKQWDDNLYADTPAPQAPPPAPTVKRPRFDGDDDDPDPLDTLPY